MNLRLTKIFGLIGVLAMAGCSKKSDDDDASSTTTKTWSDVGPIVKEKCSKCHGTINAPYNLGTDETVFKTNFEDVKKCIKGECEAPNHTIMPPTTSTALKQDEINTINAYSK